MKFTTLVLNFAILVAPFAYVAYAAPVALNKDAILPDVAGEPLLILPFTANAPIIVKRDIKSVVIGHTLPTDATHSLGEKLAPAVVDVVGNAANTVVGVPERILRTVDSVGGAASDVVEVPGAVTETLGNVSENDGVVGTVFDAVAGNDVPDSNHGLGLDNDGDLLKGVHVGRGTGGDVNL
ncbi:hypothetical protein EUX98_g1906 [Antrodiella citrinella]|uniref:Uncharacterized protein n=1 Tax=Antrodiella citrinella TaxID=2447956 RepID=A0A4S4N3B5_9APHY|nr:hypothetical protein EUX98_g1906 [Antrodiella citrinella]